MRTLAEAVAFIPVSGGSSSCYPLIENEDDQPKQPPQKQQLLQDNVVGAENGEATTADGGSGGAADDSDTAAATTGDEESDETDEDSDAAAADSAAETADHQLHTKEQTGREPADIRIGSAGSSSGPSSPRGAGDPDTGEPPRTASKRKGEEEEKPDEEHTSSKTVPAAGGGEVGGENIFGGGGVDDGHSNDGAPRTREELKAWVGEAVNVLREHLNAYGVCVMDHFLGHARGSALMQEIHRLEAAEPFRDGQLMAANGKDSPSIRSDKIAWTDGVQPPCPNLRYLIQLLDSIVLTADRVQNTKELGNSRITGRTKAMVACYPGNGAHYVKHVDNANNDGRLITAIYYTNKDWRPEDGGTLRIFSKCMNGAVADVMPIFDRVVFFWSDSRNPHEVLPAYRSRYAVTVWYMQNKD